LYFRSLFFDTCVGIYIFNFSFSVSFFFNLCSRGGICDDVSSVAELYLDGSSSSSTAANSSHQDHFGSGGGASVAGSSSSSVHSHSSPPSKAPHNSSPSSDPLIGARVVLHSLVAKPQVVKKCIG
jgi:hypothetical protein